MIWRRKAQSGPEKVPPEPLNGTGVIQHPPALPEAPEGQEEVCGVKHPRKNLRCTLPKYHSMVAVGTIWMDHVQDDENGTQAWRLT